MLDLLFIEIRVRCITWPRHAVNSYDIPLKIANLSFIYLHILHNMQAAGYILRAIILTECLIHFILI